MYVEGRVKLRVDELAIPLGKDNFICEGKNDKYDVQLKNNKLINNYNEIKPAI